MSEFDPSKRCRVHDRLNDKTLDWDPVWADDYRRNANYYGHGLDVVNWDGLLLDDREPFGACAARAET
jgi:hypothetical protein